MHTYRAIAFNEKGFTFTFTFQNPNWMEIDIAAQNALDKVVANNPLHQKHGPWNYRNINRHS